LIPLTFRATLKESTSKAAFSEREQTMISTNSTRSTRPGVPLSAAAIAFIALAVLLPAPAAAQKKAVKGKEVDKVLRAKDGVGIAITYFPSTLGKDAPAVIMLHMKGSNRLVWKTKGLAKRLQSYGYAVVTVDLRKHGESAGGGKGAELRPVDYQNMVKFDLLAVKDFLYREHQAKQLNMGKTAIVAAEMSAPVAAVFASLDWMTPPWPDAPTPAASTPRGQIIRAVVFLSPSESVLGLNPGKAYHQLGARAFNVAVLVGYGKGDVVDRGGKKTLGIYKRISSNAGTKGRIYLKEYNTKLRGTDMLGRRLNVETNIINFLNKHLKKLPDPWQSRKSRLE
jgi:hypothetical protein